MYIFIAVDVLAEDCFVNIVGSCYCNESLMNNSIKYVCTGSKTSPCEIVDGVYQVAT